MAKGSLAAFVPAALGTSAFGATSSCVALCDPDNAAIDRLGFAAVIARARSSATRRQK